MRVVGLRSSDLGQGEVVGSEQGKQSPGPVEGVVVWCEHRDVVKHADGVGEARGVDDLREERKLGSRLDCLEQRSVASCLHSSILRSASKTKLHCTNSSKQFLSLMTVEGPYNNISCDCGEIYKYLPFEVQY
jgi:hypothetical protein